MFVILWNMTWNVSVYRINFLSVEIDMWKFHTAASNKKEVI
jgi:hypothetical protein